MNGKSIVIAVLIVLALMTGALYGSGGNVWAIIDLLSLGVVAGFSLVLLRSNWTFRMMAAAFRNAVSDNAGKQELEQARLFFATARTYLLVSGFSGVLLGVINMLRNLDDYTMLGRNFAVALICPFYSLLFILLLCQPLEAAAKRRLTALN